MLVCDSAKTQKKREVKDFCTQIRTTLNIFEAEAQWANRSELWVGLVKESTRKDLRDSGSPIVLWDYCMERRVLIYQVTAKKQFQLLGMNPRTEIQCRLVRMLSLAGFKMSLHLLGGGHTL